MDLEPLAEAVARLDPRTPIGRLLRRADWERVPTALHDRARFTASVTSARILQTIQDRLRAQVQPATFDRASFIDTIRNLARDEGLSDDGGLTDLSRIPRLGVASSLQNQMAGGFARHTLETSESALSLAPAYRLGSSSAQEPRTSAWWEARWAEAGAAVNWAGALPDQFVALKTSPIWAALSRFHTPWPPFDWGSTRDLEDVDRDETIALGLLEPDEIPTPNAEEADDFNDQLEASAKGLSAELREKLQQSFGDQVHLIGDILHWEGQNVPGNSNGPGDAPASPAGSIPPTNPTPTLPSIPPETKALMNRLTKRKASPVIVDAASKLPARAVELLQDAKFRFGKKFKAFYTRHNKTIHLRRDPDDWNGTASTFYHEIGHHLHYETGIIDLTSTRPDFQAALAADYQTWQKHAETVHGTGWAGVYSATDAWNIYKMLDTIAQQMGFEDYEHAKMPEALRIVRAADTIMGLSRGQYGAGHNKSYMMAKGGKEVFAHAFSAAMDQDREWQAFFPEVTKFVKQEFKL